jgi:hypothetical protein
LTSARQPLNRSLFLALVVLVAVLFGPSSSYAQNDANLEQQIAALQSRTDDAVARVKEIVNQPVTHLSRSPNMRVAVYSPGWFHDGAETPDFATVDVRATQELIYAKYAYVSSDLNPDEAFIGNELEFNSMTKYFYTDRTIPKRRLNEDEMLEINGLYRTIAQCTQQIEQLKGRGSPAFMRMSEFSGGTILVIIGLAIAIFYLILPVMRAS